MKRVTAFASALAFGVASFAAPAMAQSKNEADIADTVEEVLGEDEELQPEAPRVYEKINYDVTQDPENILHLDLSNGERVSIRLMPSWAPNHIERIKQLARSGFYNGVIFHRVIDGFMAQSGDPTGTGQGSSQMPDLKAEFNPMPHIRGSFSMARAQSDDSANSQFFIVFYPRMQLDKKYTNLGRVIRNMAAVDAIERGEPPTNPTRIIQASIAADGLAQAYPTPSLPTNADISADMLSNSTSE